MRHRRSRWRYRRLPALEFQRADHRRGHLPLERRRHPRVLLQYIRRQPPDAQRPIRPSDHGYLLLQPVHQRVWRQGRHQNGRGTLPPRPGVLLPDGRLRQRAVCHDARKARALHSCRDVRLAGEGVAGDRAADERGQVEDLQRRRLLPCRQGCGMDAALPPLPQRRGLYGNSAMAEGCRLRPARDEV